MKKLLLLFLIVVSSCNKSEDENLLPNSVNLQKIEQVVKTKGREEQRVVYRLLQPTEKRYLWSEKVTNLIQTKSSHFTDKQLQLLKDVQRQVNKVSIFIEDSDEAEYFKTIVVPSLLKKLKKEFTREQIVNIFYKINNVDRQKTNRKGIIRTSIYRGGGTCECNVGSLFSCSHGQWCSNDSCTLPHYFKGCGFVWLFSCNGLCRIKGIEEKPILKEGLKEDEITREDEIRELDSIIHRKIKNKVNLK